MSTKGNISSFSSEIRNKPMISIPNRSICLYPYHVNPHAFNPVSNPKRKKPPDDRCSLSLSFCCFINFSFGLRFSCDFIFFYNNSRTFLSNVLRMVLSLTKRRHSD